MKSYSKKKLLKVSYTIDKGRLKKFIRIRGFYVMKMILVVFSPLIAMDIHILMMGEQAGAYKLYIPIILLFLILIAIGQIGNQQLPWNDIEITIDYKTGELTRNGSYIIPLKTNIRKFNRKVKRKDGIKLFKNNWHYWSSYLGTGSELNRKEWNFFIPYVLHNYEEIEERFINNKWL